MRDARSRAGLERHANSLDDEEQLALRGLPYGIVQLAAVDQLRQSNGEASHPRLAGAVVRIEPNLESHRRQCGGRGCCRTEAG